MVRYTSARIIRAAAAATAAVALFAFVGTAAHAAPVTLVNDTFDVGTPPTPRNDAADPNDISFFRTGGSSTLTVATTDTGLTGNALRFAPSSTFQNFLGFFPDADADANSLQELAVGDRLELAFDVRFETAPSNASAGFRFGVFNSNDAQQADDNFGSSANNFNARADDRGYFFGVNVGLDAASGTGLNEEVATDGTLLGGANPTITTVFNSVNAGTSPVNFRVVLERTGENALSIGLSINGSPLETFVDTTPLTTAFDEIAFGAGGNSEPFVVDNVNVTFTPVPEPAGITALLSVGALLLRRRRAGGEAKSS